MSKSMSTPATVLLNRLGIAFTTHIYAHDPAAASYGLEAADALGLDPHRVFKTLLVAIDGSPAVGIVPVNRTLDLKAIAATRSGRKAVLMDANDVQRLTGYVIGGISPIGQKRALPTILDRSAQSFVSIYVSGGRRGLDIGLAPDDLVSATSAEVADIAR